MAWRIIMRFGFHVGFIDTSLQVHLIITAHTLNSVLTTSVWRISMRNLSLISDWCLTPRIHECIVFYNCHADGTEVTMSNSSSVLLCCHRNAFVNIRCRENKCLPSRCPAMDVCSGSTIPAFSCHVTVLSTDFTIEESRFFLFGKTVTGQKDSNVWESLLYDHKPVSRIQDLQVENWYEFSFIGLYTSNYT
jgi:hypothetical protein